MPFGQLFVVLAGGDTTENAGGSGGGLGGFCGATFLGVLLVGGTARSDPPSPLGGDRIFSTGAMDGETAFGVSRSCTLDVVEAGGFDLPSTDCPMTNPPTAKIEVITNTILVRFHPLPPQAAL